MSTEALKAAVKGNGAAVANTDKSKDRVVAFRTFMEKNKTQLAAALPRHMAPDRMIRLAVTEFAKNPYLQKCTALSVYGAIIQSSQLGLEIGVLGQAYLVPFKNKDGDYEAQFIPGYKGLISLARRSGEVTSIETHIVYEKDEFSMCLGLNTQVDHKPHLEGDRGKPRLVYGVAKFRDGGYHFEWMNMAEVERIRNRSKAKNNGPWVTDYEQMVRKTLIRRMCNYLPMSVELAAALAVDEAVSNGDHATLDGDFVVTTQEAGEHETTTQHPTQQANADDAAPTADELVANVAKVETAEALDELADVARSLPDAEREVVESAIMERAGELSKQPEPQPAGRRRNADI